MRFVHHAKGGGRMRWVNEAARERRQCAPWKKTCSSPVRGVNSRRQRFGRWRAVRAAARGSQGVEVNARHPASITSSLIRRLDPFYWGRSPGLDNRLAF